MVQGEEKKNMIKHWLLCVFVPKMFQFFNLDLNLDVFMITWNDIIGSVSPTSIRTRDEVEPWKEEQGSLAFGSGLL